jgi:dTDP-4-amino-4,6-dideoxygalactose transaminase
VAEVARSLRHHGQGASLEEVVAIGHDWLLDEVRAVLLRAQLRRLPHVIAHRRKIAAAYGEALRTAGDPRIVPPRVEPGTEPAYYKYPVVLPHFGAAALRRRLGACGIEAGQLYWPPVHRMPAYAALGVTMPKTDAILRQRICLPMHGLVDPSDCQEIVQVLRRCLDDEALGRDAGMVNLP